MTAASTAYGSSTVKRLRRSQTELAAINDAIVEAVSTEHPVTLRGVYYRVVSAGAVEKTEAGYRLVGRQLLKLRRDGTVPYHWITDGTRWITKPDSFTGTEQALNDMAASYRRALWHDQPVEVHVFTEKDAISGVLLPVTEQWDVPLGVLRGYSSESFTHSVAEAIKGCGKRTVYVLQLGDHDPSGVDAWRAFRESVVGFLGMRVTPQMVANAARLHITVPEVGKTWGIDVDIDADDDVVLDWPDAITYGFCGGLGFHDAELRKVTFARLAVTEDQIEQWSLPTRPTKRTDTRARAFVGESVEVDAIPANTLRQIVGDAIASFIDPEARRINDIVEEQERAGLAALAGGWSR